MYIKKTTLIILIDFETKIMYKIAFNMFENKTIFEINNTK